MIVPLPRAKRDELKAHARDQGMAMGTYVRHLIYRELRAEPAAVWAPPGTATR